MGEPEDIFTRRQDKLRCPTCHIKSFDIEDDSKANVKSKSPTKKDDNNKGKLP